MRGRATRAKRRLTLYRRIAVVSVQQATSETRSTWRQTAIEICVTLSLSAWIRKLAIDHFGERWQRMLSQLLEADDIPDVPAAGDKLIGDESSVTLPRQRFG